jgi:endonuclease/exonuclease/phosphatase family metal-dependent hydrolase
MHHLTVTTFNIRYDEPADGRHAWPHRRGLAIETILAQDPDLLGLQEPSPAQWTDIASALPAWSPFGVLPEEIEDLGPQGGFVRTVRFEVRATGTFWLSETPHVAGSVSWPNDWGSRACGWVRLHDRFANSELLFACTHFDTNAGAWLPSARVLHAELDRVAAGMPVILVGDFNCPAGSDAHQYLCGAAGYHDAWTESGNADAGVVTFNGFTSVACLPGEAGDLGEWVAATSGGIEKFAHYPALVGAHRNYRIDWILLRGRLTCTAAVIDSRSDGLLPSDHYPVTATIEWRE